MFDKSDFLFALHEAALHAQGRHDDKSICEAIEGEGIPIARQDGSNNYETEGNPIFDAVVLANQTPAPSVFELMSAAEAAWEYYREVHRAVQQQSNWDATKD